MQGSGKTKGMQMEVEMKHQILLINDMTGYEKVALSAMIPILSRMGNHVYNLPTALISNTLDYGKYEILETTEYMMNTMRVWEELGFSFDAVSTGFIVNHRQAQLLAEFCGTQSRKGAMIFCDPIMGDNGKLYNGITEERVRDMRQLIATADVVFPNYTEAAYLTGSECIEGKLTERQAWNLIDGLKGVGAKSVIITSLKLEGGHTVGVYDAERKETFFLPYKYVPAQIPGTGDIFSAIVIGNLLNGNTMKDSVKRAILIVSHLIKEKCGNADQNKGIALETYLELFDQ